MERISQYFDGVAWKYLTAVDAEPDSSHQHEFGGLVKAGFKRYLGDPGPDTSHFEATFVYLEAETDESLVAKGTVSWYDARRKKGHRGPELRLYYQSNSVAEAMQEGDFFLIAKKKDDALLIVVARPNSTEERQLRWLFDLAEGHPAKGFAGKGVVVDIEKPTVSAAFILEAVGIEPESGSNDGALLDLLIEKFGSRFPTTRVFSDFARQIASIQVREAGPDKALMAWLDKEEELFRIFERHQVQEKLDSGIRDVDEFISYSLSVQNRRKSRAGHSLENHLEQVFTDLSVQFTRGARTEERSTPDFLFPGSEQYHDPTFPSDRLFMLGAKSTCKERWRQVLAEAERIQRKHLLTLEAGISSHQLEEMSRNKLQLVVPALLKSSYQASDTPSILSLGEFVAVVS